MREFQHIRVYVLILVIIFSSIKLIELQNINKLLPKYKPTTKYIPNDQSSLLLFISTPVKYYLFNIHLFCLPILIYFNASISIIKSNISYKNKTLIISK
jgi:hypothetical protein